MFGARLVRDSDAARSKELPAISPSDLTGGNWAIAPLQVAAVWGREHIDGRGVTVGIVDSGLDPLMDPALARRVIAYRDFTRRNPAMADSIGHGTAVASLVAGSGGLLPLGVAPGARLVVARVASGPGDPVDPAAVDAAIAWMTTLDPDGDPSTRDGARVINISLGSRGDDPARFEASTRAAVDAGIVVVAAAGNDGSAADAIALPAGFPHVIAVGSTDSDGAVSAQSSRGAPESGKPDVLAPGEFVGNGARIGSGTSLAAPLVSGVVALMLEADPTLRPAAVAEILRATATRPSGRRAGPGLVDAAAAVRVVRTGLRMAPVSAPRVVATSDVRRSGSDVTTLVLGRSAPSAGPIQVRLDRGTWSSPRWRPAAVIDIGASGVVLAPLGRGCHRIEVRQDLGRGRVSPTRAVGLGTCPTLPSWARG